jgi:hypothetical protein
MQPGAAKLPLRLAPHTCYLLVMLPYVAHPRTTAIDTEGLGEAAPLFNGEDSMLVRKGSSIF